MYGACTQLVESVATLFLPSCHRSVYPLSVVDVLPNADVEARFVDSTDVHQ